MGKGVYVKDFVERISALAYERIAAENVISLNELRKIKNRKPQSTVLLIDDDEHIRKALIRLFEKEKYRVFAVSNAVELMNLIEDVLADIIILDVGLPWIDGYEIAKLMKEHPELRHIPIIFMSAKHDMHAMKKAFRVGAHDYITKPFDLDEMKKSVSVILELQD